MLFNIFCRYNSHQITYNTSHAQAPVPTHINDEKLVQIFFFTFGFHHCKCEYERKQNKNKFFNTLRSIKPQWKNDESVRKKIWNVRTLASPVHHSIYFYIRFTAWTSHIHASYTFHNVAFAVCFFHFSFFFSFEFIFNWTTKCFGK